MTSIIQKSGFPKKEMSRWVPLTVLFFLLVLPIGTGRTQSENIGARSIADIEASLSAKKKQCDSLKEAHKKLLDEVKNLKDEEVRKRAKEGRYINPVRGIAECELDVQEDELNLNYLKEIQEANKIPNQRKRECKISFIEKKYRNERKWLDNRRAWEPEMRMCDFQCSRNRYLQAQGYSSVVFSSNCQAYVCQEEKKQKRGDGKAYQSNRKRNNQEYQGCLNQEKGTNQAEAAAYALNIAFLESLIKYYESVIEEQKKAKEKAIAEHERGIKKFMVQIDKDLAEVWNYMNDKTLWDELMERLKIKKWNVPYIYNSKQLAVIARYLEGRRNYYISDWNNWSKSWLKHLDQKYKEQTKIVKAAKKELEESRRKLQEYIDGNITTPSSTKLDSRRRSTGERREVHQQSGVQQDKVTSEKDSGRYESKTDWGSINKESPSSGGDQTSAPERKRKIPDGHKTSYGF